jgi:hypothetical protein
MSPSPHLGRRGREVGRPDLDTEAVIEPGGRKEGTVAFSMCDRCKNLFVLGDDQARHPNTARCPYCKVPLRVISREEFFEQLNRQDKTKRDPQVEGEEGSMKGGMALATVRKAA